MVLAEVGYLAEKKKIEITLLEILVYLNKYNFKIHATDSAVIKSTFEITHIPELHDRIIAASGRYLGCSIITNDPKIIDSSFVSTVWS